MRSPRLEEIPDETTILKFRHLLKASDLAEDIFKQVNAHLARKGLLLKRGQPVAFRDEGAHWCGCGLGLVHTVTTTAANEADVEQVGDLLHGKEDTVWADSGDRGA